MWNGTKLFPAMMNPNCARDPMRCGERWMVQFCIDRYVHFTVGETVVVQDATTNCRKYCVIFSRGRLTTLRYIHRVLQPHLRKLLQTLAYPLLHKNSARPDVLFGLLEKFQRKNYSLGSSITRTSSSITAMGNDGK